MIRTESMERALPAIVGFITDKIGIPVLRGMRACTTGKVIYVPKLPDLGLGLRDVVRVIAYIYHECFHVLWTNFGLNVQNLPPLQDGVFRVLEDIRIEHKGIARFPSARKYLGQLVQIFTEDGLAGLSPGFPPMVDVTEAKLLQFYMLYKLRHDVLKQTGILPALEPTVAAARSKFPPGMLVRLDALMFEVTQCDSTDDALQLAADIAEMIKEEQEKEEERKQQQQQQQQQQQDEEGGGQGNEDAGNDASEQNDSTAGDSSGVEQGGQSKSESNTGEDDGKASDSSDVGGGGAGGDSTGDLDSLLSMGKEDIAETLDEMLEEVINAVAEQHAGKGVSMPNVHALRLTQKNVNIGDLRASINAVRTKTLQWMASQTETDVMHSRMGVHLDFSRLHQAKRGGEIFIRSDEGIDLNAAISIVIDRSGSMSGIIEHAARAAVASMLAFDVPGIATQVSVFPAYAHLPDGSYDEGVAVVKRWDESPRHLAERIAGLSVDGGTPMAEAILFGAANLVRRDETLRMIVVVTDGEPNDPQSTREVIDTARRSGITVVGLGIGVDPSAVFGSKFSAELNSVNELSSAMIKLVRSAMISH